MKVGSMFSGIGGLDLGLERAGMRVVWQAENDPYCSRVLAKHWPHIPNLGDVTRIDWSTTPRVDLICGGYPCQPFSLAGRRMGEADPRHLWPHMLDAIRVLRPRYALLENVPGHLALGFGRVLGDLAEIGYDAEWDCIPAAAVGAPHLRWRIFVVAYPGSTRRRQDPRSTPGDEGEHAGGATEHDHVADGDGESGRAGHVADTSSPRRHEGSGLGRTWQTPVRSGGWDVEPDVGRLVARVPTRLAGGRLDADASEDGATEILRAMRNGNASSPLRWTTRGLRDLQATEVLLAQVCEYQGPPIPLGDVSLASPPASRLVMRGVWFDGTSACPSCRRAATEQRSEQHPDALRVLPQLLACDCGATWLDPTGTHARDRVDRLRALGNAVVPQVAEHIGRLILEAAA